MTPVGTVRCFLCRGFVSYKNGDKTRFEAHIKNEHGGYFDFDFLLAICMLDDYQKNLVVDAVGVKTMGGEDESSDGGKDGDPSGPLTCTGK